MNGLTHAVALILISQAPAGHSANPLASALRADGWKVGTTTVEFPAPLLPDDADPTAEAAALRKIAGSERASMEFTRDSVTAPVVLKLSDQKADGGVVRIADLWFVVRADLDSVDFDKPAADVQTVEAGNMAFTTKVLKGNAKGAGGVKEAGVRDWSVKAAARLLDRIEAEAVDRVTASKTAGSIVVGLRTSPDGSENVWRAIARTGANDAKPADQPFAGGAGVATVTRLQTIPGALLVEARFAFFEPTAWFDGAPILRSKIGVVVQDRVRGLRRELAKSRGGPNGRKPVSAGAGGG